MDLTQTVILITSMASVSLVQFDNIKVRRYASIFALVGQPAWFISSYQSGQAGIFLASFIYSSIWMYGFYKGWIKRR